MEFFRNPKINFVGAMKPAFTVSVILVIVAAASLIFHRGPRMSIDFAGGSILQVQVTPTPAVDDIRAGLEGAGYEGVQVQEFGQPNEFLITFPVVEGEDAEAAGESATDAGPEGTAAAADAAPETDDFGGQMLDETNVYLEALRGVLPGHEVEFRRQEAVGPKIGGELRAAAANAIAMSLVLIVIYIWLRFVLRYGIAAIIALIHDVTLTLGVFSLLDFEVSLSVIAAFLTIIGYSLNDTIVVFDRIRENMKLRRRETYREVINRSINECLSRTVLTSMTTFFVSATLYVFGGPVIHDFAFALCFGVIVGTYSSMFIASPVLVFWYERFIAEKKRVSTTM